MHAVCICPWCHAFRGVVLFLGVFGKLIKESRDAFEHDNIPSEHQVTHEHTEDTLSVDHGRPAMLVVVEIILPVVGEAGLVG